MERKLVIVLLSAPKQPKNLATGQRSRVDHGLSSLWVSEIPRGVVSIHTKAKVVAAIVSLEESASCLLSQRAILVLHYTRGSIVDNLLYLFLCRLVRQKQELTRIAHHSRSLMTSPTALAAILFLWSSGRPALMSRTACNLRIICSTF